MTSMYSIHNQQKRTAAATTMEKGENSSTKHDERKLKNTASMAAYLPDPAMPYLKQSAGTGLLESGSGSTRPWVSDEYVPMRCYRGSLDEDSQFTLVVSESPVLISDLRSTEQNVAYEALLARASPGKIKEYYSLHLLRLKRIREAIVASEVKLERFRGDQIQRVDDIYNASLTVGAGGMDDRAGVGEVGAESRNVVPAAGKDFSSYLKAIKEKKKLRACEGIVKRLLKRCEDAGEGVLGFEKVTW